MHLAYSLTRRVAGPQPLLLALLFALSSCALFEPEPEPVFIDPEPIVIGEETDDAVEEQAFDIQRIFFGTDRNALTDDAGLPAFGHSRANKLTVGITDVSIPRNTHVLGNVERPKERKILWLTISREEEDPRRHFTIVDRNILKTGAFRRLAGEAAQQAQTYQSTAFVFIHGFNTTFDEATYRAAQMAYDLGFDGPAFLYSWPSTGNTLDYVTDLDSADNAARYIDSFLDIVFRTPGVEKVHLIAHSMGNAALAELLTQRGTKLSRRGQAIDQLILAAPDLDAGEFGNIAEFFTETAKGVTLYACETDRALLASQKLRSDYIRLGDVGPGGPMVVKDVDTIDVSAVGTELFSLNHNVYAKNRGVLDDIGALFLSGVRPPGKRMPTLRERTGNFGVYWSMPR